jgi:hypothetical protein
MGLRPCQSTQGLPRFWIAPPLSHLHSTPTCRLPLGPRLGLVLMLAVASVPHSLPLAVTCCFFFSSTDAILLSKLCLSSVLSGWIKVSHVVILRIRTISPLLRPCSPQLNCCCYKQVIYSLRKALHVFLCWVTILFHMRSCCPPTLHFFQPHNWCLMKASEVGEGAMWC